MQGFFDSPANLFAMGGTLLIASGLGYVMMTRDGSPTPKPSDKVKDNCGEKKDLAGDSDEVDTRTKLTVYFGSQTGTSEGQARTLNIEGAEKEFDVSVVDLEDFEEEEAAEMWASKAEKKEAQIFLMATYGEGEPTDNANIFIRWLKTEAKENNKSMSNVPFMVFGLGNTQYEHYNAMGKLVDKLVEELGGNRILPLGMGDDDKSMEDDFEAWKEKVWNALESRYKANTTKKRTKSRGMSMDDLPTCQYEVEILDKPQPCEIPSDDQINASNRHFFHCYDVPITVNKELRSKEDGGSTKHIEVDLKKAEPLKKNAGSEKLSYLTADNCGVLPLNSSDVVSALADKLNFDLKQSFRLIPNKHADAKTQKSFKHIFPTPCTVEDCLGRYCDLTSVPRRSELKVLALYARDKVDRQALLRMASKEGKEEYKSKIESQHVGVVKLITKFVPSVKMTLPEFIAFCPRLVPRMYTISSSSSVHPKSLAMTVSVIKEKNEDGTIFSGVCSTHLANVDNCRIFVRPSTFRLPVSVSTPIIMIGPGTGVAPMRALLQEREHQAKKEKVKGNNVLYFGSKNRKLDYLYSEEFDAWEKCGVLTKLYLAFSREQKQKIYVQHLLAKNAQDTWDLVKSGAYIYICGGTGMGKDVVKELSRIAKEVGGVADEDAFISQLKSARGDWSRSCGHKAKAKRLKTFAPHGKKTKTPCFNHRKTIQQFRPHNPATPHSILNSPPETPFFINYNCFVLI